MIFKISIYLLLLGIIQSAAIKTNDEYSLTVTTYGFKNTKGLANFYLFNSADTYLKNDKSFRKISSVITGDSSKAIFANLHAGIYAVSCFHDENKNGEYDTNFIGYPKEAIGFSGNTKTFIGPRKYQDAKFELKQSRRIVIRLWNP